MVSTSLWVQALEREGYVPNAKAIAVLENLGGLTVIPETYPEALFHPAKMMFDPVRAGSGEFDRVDWWQRACGLSLFPVAEADPVFNVVVAENGKVFDGRDSTFCQLGYSIEEALEVLLLACRKPIPMLLPV
jgi:hypothetical protein